MAKDGFRVFDSDMHVLEPPDLWERYLDRAFRHRAPRGSRRTPLDLGVTVDGTHAFRFTPHASRLGLQERGGAERFAEDIARGFDAPAQLHAMDREGIDVTVLYPSRGLFVNSYPDMDAAFSAAIARAYNDWMADFCQAGDPKRMLGAAMVPIQDLDAAIREAERAVQQLGFRAIFLRPNPPRPGVYWHQRAFDPCGRRSRPSASRSGSTRAWPPTCPRWALTASATTSSRSSTRARTQWSRCWRSRR
jgi:hypothetical protein